MDELASIRTSVPACVSLVMPHNDSTERVRSMIRSELDLLLETRTHTRQALERTLEILRFTELPSEGMQLYVAVTDDGRVVEEVVSTGPYSLYLLDKRLHVVGRH